MNKYQKLFAEIIPKTAEHFRERIEVKNPTIREIQLIVGYVLWIGLPPFLMVFFAGPGESFSLWMLTFTIITAFLNVARSGAAMERMWRSFAKQLTVDERKKIAIELRDLHHRKEFRELINAVRPEQIDLIAITKGHAVNIMHGDIGRQAKALAFIFGSDLNSLASQVKIQLEVSDKMIRNAQEEALLKQVELL